MLRLLEDKLGLTQRDIADGIGISEKMDEYEALRVEIERLNQELSEPRLFYRQEDKIKAQLIKKK
jgi:regulator of replication initiation timing